MPYYKNVGLCNLSYYGVSIEPGQVKKFPNCIDNDNLIVVDSNEVKHDNSKSCEKKYTHTRKRRQNVSVNEEVKKNTSVDLSTGEKKYDHDNKNDVGIDTEKVNNDNDDELEK